MLKITAVIAARNELVYLKVLIPYLLSENIDIVLIDNDSDDGTTDYVLREFHNIPIEHLPYKGEFDLTEQLNYKKLIANSISTDWIIHHDADEIMHDSSGWKGLRASIEKANELGCNALNFQELVMLPFNPEIDNVLSNNKNYYYFSPKPLRKMTTYKSGEGIDNINSGGHKLIGNIKLYGEIMFIRHYIVRSQVHAFSKLNNRLFSKRDLDRGWHGNRLNISKKSLVIPKEHNNLNLFPSYFNADEVLSKPLSKHYWEW